MSNRILFAEKLQHKLADILTQAGFQLVEIVTEPFELLKYERYRASASRPDVIAFHGLEKNHPNYIYSTAATVSGGGFFLKSIKELLPNFMLLPIQQTDKWVYNNNEELDDSLNEIFELVKGRLLKWFDSPTLNPSGVDMSITATMSKVELTAKLQEQIKIFELARQRAQADGRAEDIERYERAITEFKEKLSSLKPDSA